MGRNGGVPAHRGSQTLGAKSSWTRVAPMVLLVAARPHLLGYPHQGLQIFPFFRSQVLHMVEGAVLTLAALGGGAEPELPVEFFRIDWSVACGEHGALELAVADVEADHFEVMLDAVADAWCNGLSRLYGQPYPLEQGGLLCRGQLLVCLRAIFRVHSHCVLLI